MKRYRGRDLSRHGGLLAAGKAGYVEFGSKLSQASTAGAIALPRGSARGALGNTFYIFGNTCPGIQPALQYWDA